MKILISADWHLRADRPRCRTDEDWENSQEIILSQIAQIANDNDVDVYIGGDLLHTPQVPSRIISMFLRFSAQVNRRVFVIAGNHDLSYHSWNTVSTSSFGIIQEIIKKGESNINTPGELGEWAHFDQPFTGENNGIRFIHRLVFPSAKDLPPNVDACLASELLQEFPDSKWIFTGDYHHSFHYEKNGRHVVNPGCINRQAADMIDYNPSVYLVDTDAGLVEMMSLNDPLEYVTDEYLRVEEEREERIAAFVETVRTSGDVSLDFAANIEKALLVSKDMAPEDKNMVRLLMEGK